jgi:iron complex transport system ATP-binding protein
VAARALARILGARVIQARDLHYRAGARALVSGASLRVGAGDVVAVVGPNGAGKSTLLRMLGGELRPAGGEVLLHGRPIGDWSPGDRARARAVLPQHSALSFPFTVRDVVRLGRMPYDGAGGRAVDTALERTGLSRLESRLYPTLSGGERQLVHLARVLAQLAGVDGSPAGRLLLLDEPVAGLDPAHQHRVMAIAREEARRGAGVLAVLHDLNLAAQYADTLLVLHGGRVVRQGRAAEVLTSEMVRQIFALTATIVPHPCFECPLVVAHPHAAPTRLEEISL